MGKTYGVLLDFHFYTGLFERPGSIWRAVILLRSTSVDCAPRASHTDRCVSGVRRSLPCACAQRLNPLVALLILSHPQNVQLLATREVPMNPRLNRFRRNKAAVITATVAAVLVSSVLIHRRAPRNLVIRSILSLVRCKVYVQWLACVIMSTLLPPPPTPLRLCYVAVSKRIQQLQVFFCCWCSETGHGRTCVPPPTDILPWARPTLFPA